MDEHGDLLDRAIASLRELPDVRPDATARLLVAVAAERQRTREAAVSDGALRARWLPWAAIAAAAIVILAVSVLPVAQRHNAGSQVAVSTTTPAEIPALSTSNDASGATAPRAVQLVFSAPQARDVRVVGDFNGWDERLSPMVRDEASGLWSVSLMLRPGRHVYAFVVNDTQWVRDPRAVAAPDADFGRPGSVLLVGRP